MNNEPSPFTSLNNENVRKKPTASGGTGGAQAKVNVPGGRQDRRGSTPKGHPRGRNLRFSGRGLRPGKYPASSGSRPNAIVKSRFVSKNKDSTRHLRAHLAYIDKSPTRSRDTRSPSEPKRPSIDQDPHRSSDIDLDDPDRSFDLDYPDLADPDHVDNPSIYASDSNRIDPEDFGPFYNRERSGFHQAEVFDFISSHSGSDNVAFHKMILSPGDNSISVKDFVRDSMQALEKELGYPVDWFATSHFDTAHNHAHVLIAGRNRSDDKDVHMNTANLDNFRATINDFLARQRGFDREYDRALAKELQLDSPAQTDRDAAELLRWDRPDPRDPGEQHKLPVRQRLKDEALFHSLGLRGAFEGERDPVMQKLEQDRLEKIMDRIETQWESEQQLTQDAFRLGQGLSVTDPSSASSSNPHSLNDDRSRDDEDDQSRKR